MSTFGDITGNDSSNKGTREVPEWLQGVVGLVLGSMALMWLVEIVDSIALNNKLQGGGIHPRDLDGLDGILWSPFLHVGWSHIISNTIPFIVLGGLVALRGGTRTWLTVSGAVAVLGGLATWLFARSGNHVGASGVIFGYLGYLVGSAVFERSLKSIAVAVVAIMLYGGMIFGIVPTGDVSWEGHLFGALAGAGTAFALNQPETKAEPASLFS